MSDLAQRLPVQRNLMPDRAGGEPPRAVEWVRKNLFSSVFNGILTIVVLALAALSLGLRPRQVLSKIILPQALRVMVPPTTSQYLNIIKSSSLGAAVAYPELYEIFAGTAMMQSNREIESIALLMGVFLSINLVVSAFMNWYNRRIVLVGAR